MIVLVGIGQKIDDITLEGLKWIKNSDLVYFDSYTSYWFGDLKKLERLAKRKIKLADRRQLEDKVDSLIEEARNKIICILVPGDPLFATTHISILIEAKRKGIETKVVHSISIVNLMLESGLHAYKFGSIVTIPFKKRTKEFPESLRKTIEANKKRGLHTLCLLDIDLHERRFLNPKEAIGFLLQNKLVKEKEKLIVLCRLGLENCKIYYEEARKLLKKDFGGPPFSIIIPGKLHFTEKEYLELFANPNED